MYDIYIKNYNKKIQAEHGESILKACLRNNIDIPNNCEGNGGCGTCHVYIIEGMENLSEIDELEEEGLDKVLNLKLNSRLSCLVKIYGNVIIEIPNNK